jgi:glycosyltransferase involved in cell wall biosynthesis
VLLSGYPLIDVILPPEERKFHLWVGRADPMKQPFLFLQLAKQIPESQFVMICPPNINRNASEYISLQEEAASIPNLEFIPFVHFPKINPYFQQAITLVNTSGSEGFPNTYIQASLNSTPIMSLGVNPNQFLTEYNCGKTFKDDLSLMAQFIQELDQTSDSYRQMSENAFRYAKKNHDISHITSQILELIKD